MTPTRHLAHTLFSLLLLAAGVCMGGTGGCRGKPSAQGKFRVVATTTMVGDLVRRIGGDDIDLKVLLGPGTDPHTYKPSMEDIAELVNADLIVYSGLHLEGKMVDLFERKLADRSVAVTSAIPVERLHSWKEGEGGAHDPHVWFDVGLWSLAAGPVRDRLIRLDPAHADAYRRRADAVQRDLAELDREVREKIASVPPARRVLITSHDAYGYFGTAYGIEVRGLQGISTETEAGLREVNEAVAYITARGIPAIFVESSVSPKTIERVMDDVNRRGGRVEIGGELFSDAMGSPGQHPGYAVETYDGMVRYNLDTIVNALQPDAPAGHR